jgi:UDP-glucose 4-epimerase
VDLDNVFKRYPDIVGVIHFAASKAVGESVEKPLLYYRNNLGSLITLLEVMKVHQVQNLVFSSSCTVYGQPDAAHLPVDETAPIQKALSPYGNTKQINEEIICDEAHTDKDLHATILRYFNPIGAHPSAQIGELPNGVPQNLLPFITQTAAGMRPELKVFGNDYNTPDGSCIRDYIYVVDLAKAHVKAIDRMLHAKKRDQVEVFNLGTGTGLSVLTLIHEFEAATGVKIPYTIVGRREGDIEQVWAAPKKANEVLGWKADTPIREVLASAWNWEKKIRNIK